jgi:pimeloyl-ACP methyl ester carboxylesterase
MTIRCLCLLATLAYPTVLMSQAWQAALQPPGQLVDLGGYRIHIHCTGPSATNRSTVVLSPGGGDFATDWSLVQQLLSDSGRVCSYDRGGSGWSDPGPTPRTFRQETAELHRALALAGEHAPYVLVGHSLGAFVARTFALAHRAEVRGLVLVAPTNENGMLGYRGQWALPRTLATTRPIPPARSLRESPPLLDTGAVRDSCRARAARSARIWRPYDRLGAEAQRQRVWLLGHPACSVTQDDYFAEEMAAFYALWAHSSHPLDSLPLTVITVLPGSPPPGLSAAQIRADSARIDLARLSKVATRLVDSTSGHHIHLDNPRLVAAAIRDILGRHSR